jgi:hypothetical protein
VSFVAIKPTKTMAGGGEGLNISNFKGLLRKIKCEAIRILEPQRILTPRAGPM